MAYPTNSWAILPATDALFNGKQKVTIEQAMLEMGRYGGTGTMLLCERTNGDGRVTRFLLSSSGRMDLPVGMTHKAHHDQNFRSYGYVKVLDVIFYEVIKGVGGKHQVVTEGGIRGALTLDSKFPLFVFK